MAAANGADALVTAAEWKPDVILLDVMMPGMDGPQTLTHLRGDQCTANIPVVFMRRVGNPGRSSAFFLGAAWVIPKPFDPMTLATALCAYLPADRPIPARSGPVARFPLGTKSGRYLALVSAAAQNPQMIF